MAFAIAGISAAAAAMLSCFRRRKGAPGTSMLVAWEADQFAFKRAIDAYEDLIDEHAGMRP